MAALAERVLGEREEGGGCKPSETMIPALSNGYMIGAPDEGCSGFLIRRLRHEIERRSREKEGIPCLVLAFTFSRDYDQKLFGYLQALIRACIRRCFPLFTLRILVCGENVSWLLILPPALLAPVYLRQKLGLPSFCFHFHF